jgi:hypothetical protein
MDCGIVDEAVESAVTFKDALDQRAPCSLVAHVGDDVDLSCDVGGHDVPPARAEQLCFGSTLAAPRTRHYGHRTHRTSELARHRTSGSICRTAVS